MCGCGGDAGVGKGEGRVGAACGVSVEGVVDERLGWGWEAGC